MSLSSIISLPKGFIKKLIGRDITWDDDPVEINEEFHFLPDTPTSNIDWEQRRYEIAKDVVAQLITVCSYFNNPNTGYISAETNENEYCVNEALFIADELIDKLKKVK